MEINKGLLNKYKNQFNIVSFQKYIILSSSTLSERWIQVCLECVDSGSAVKLNYTFLMFVLSASNSFIFEA